MQKKIYLLATDNLAITITYFTWRTEGKKLKKVELSIQEFLV